MDILIRRCCGLDVHKQTIQACVRLVDEHGELRELIREFSSTTRELLALSDWLKGLQVTHVAMESTGVYWKPVWHILDGAFTQLLVNAQHIKHVPGRKTDVKDSQWIAQLLQHGLLRSSFVPEVPQQQWRDLTRLRTQLVARTSQTAHRIQKVLEDANIKPSCVASDVLGVSGREMIRNLIAGIEDLQLLAACAKGRLKRKAQALEEALRPFQKTLELLDGVPGVDRRVAQVILAEVGADMARFPTAGHLCSWAALCPGNHESAGKRKSGRTCKANRWLRAALVQAGWAASHTKETYLAALFRRLVGRRGKKRALVACAHSILNSVYYMLRDQVPYHDLGTGHFDQLPHRRLTRNLVKRLEAQGYRVTLERRVA